MKRLFAIAVFVAGGPPRHNGCRLDKIGIWGR
ncbi:hypothetical protein OKW40_000205 [Paraburkholderia sp. RAU6.4a]